MGVFFTLTKYTAIVTLIYLICYQLLLAWPEPKYPIYQIASQDLSTVGRYDARTSISIKYWIYAIVAYYYDVDDSTLSGVSLESIFSTDSLDDEILSSRQGQALQHIKAWLDEDVVDPCGYIMNGAKDAVRQIFKEIRDAKSNKRPVTFKVSPDYDFHVVAKSIEYNDYVNYKSLLSRLDGMEVTV